MEQKDIENIKTLIKSKIEIGDYITLSKVLGLKRETVVSRFNRNDENTVLIMKKIIKEKEVLINKVKKYASHLYST
ncbi:hypothetical protein SGQ83_12660 [Flavobacterium sp. Fl-318]|jgi:hypothetical protein|uniref:Transcriptional regulator n=1 Tax=Flavobacterium cupriresistens TaxID=2893885 RepID=A0ABU4RC85_9FLAO|nr:MULTISPECIES: hypothetical protein [unclassified Flavobacterium]MDX6190205.1 hypothetical protein [Flavobacterium sp. Fl-318]UFH43023.1 hypothetical protein LNP23_02110 [Flavobacterium sp. F-323]